MTPPVIARVFGPGAWDLHYLEAGFASSADARAALRLLREGAAPVEVAAPVAPTPRVVEVKPTVDEAALMEAACAVYQSLYGDGWMEMSAEGRRVWRLAAYRALRAAGVGVAP
jgi:hypothetical protein